MIAAIGTGGIPRPNRRLTSDAPRLPVRNLPQLGQTIVLAWKTPAGALHARVTRTAEGLVIETGGTSVLVGLREWPMPLGRGTRTRFTCSNCGALRTSSTGAACGAAAPKIVSISSIAVGMSSAGARRSAGGRSCCASLRGCRREACVDAGLGSRLRASKRRCSRTSNV